MKYGKILTPHSRLSVPNVPCGVESKEGSAGRTTSWVVPNVPCGVERREMHVIKVEKRPFLMYRVELKGYLAMGRS